MLKDGSTREGTTTWRAVREWNAPVGPRAEPMAEKFRKGEPYER